MLLHEDITEKIISSFYKVYNELGYGLLEQVYENALLIELSAMGLLCSKQVPVKVYEGKWSVIILQIYWWKTKLF